MEIYNYIWTIVESLTYIVVIAIFFTDPIRRWNFFGYRPTAVIGIYDPNMEKVLIAMVNNVWSFNQGGMYQNNIYLTVISILKREIGLPETRFKLVYTKPMGSIKLKNKKLLTRARISTISIFSQLRGKAYLACFVRANLQDIENEIKKGAGVKDVKVVTYEEAKKLVKKYQTEEHQDKKQKMIISMIDEITNYSQGVKEWESGIMEAPKNTKENETKEE